MARFVLVDCFIEIDGVDLTNHISSVTVNMSSEEIDVTTFADAGKRRAQGLKDHSFELNIQHDFDAASVDATLYPLYDTGSDFTVRVRPFSAAASATNPEFSGQCILLDYSPLAGDAGELSQASVRLPVQGVGIAKATV